jgi:four helix bundle protein
MQIKSAKELNVYKKGYELAMMAFKLSKDFHAEEKYALTSQIRRSSRSICLNLRKAWSKRRYEEHFVSKLTDCDGENSETDSSLDFAKDCGYITDEQHVAFTSLCLEIGKMLGSMLKNPGPFLITDNEASGQRSTVRSQKSDRRPLISDFRPLNSDLRLL